MNQILRFGSHVLVGVDDPDLLAAAQGQALAILGAASLVPLASDNHEPADVTLEVGLEAQEKPSWITVNSTGWVARVASGGHAAKLPWSAAASNPLGALAAACLGTGEAFFILAGVPRPPRMTEFSLLERRTAQPGTFEEGPQLPRKRVVLDGLVVGCGGVTNGWADAMRRLPVSGHLAAVDREALRLENIGPYVLARRLDLGRPKAMILADMLAPEISVTPYPEEFELFKLRLRFGLEIPPLVIGGLDDVETRHSMQRLWPAALVDMAAGGTTAQVLLHLGRSSGQCLIGALTLPPNAESYSQRIARVTGLRSERVVEEPTTLITAEDVRAAPFELRREIEAAQYRGQLVCGRITEQNLFGEEATDDFAPAAPFVSALAGTIGAAETMRLLMGVEARSGLHQQFDFRSGQTRSLVMRCPRSCECLSHEEGA